MIVVADSSPLIALVNIDHVSILQQLFHNIVIPPQVASELRDTRRPKAVREFIDSKPAWLAIRAPSRTPSFPGLHAGEAAAI